MEESMYEVAKKHSTEPGIVYETERVDTFDEAIESAETWIWDNDPSVEDDFDHDTHEGKTIVRGFDEDETECTWYATITRV